MVSLIRATLRDLLFWIPHGLVDTARWMMNQTQGYFGRRRFLKRLLSATGVASGLARWRLLGSSAGISPNEQIGIGIVGMGARAKMLLQELGEMPEARIVAVADVFRERAEQAAVPLGARVFQDFRRLLECREVDAIITATPDHWRAAICILACQAGKDIYAEKPLSLTVREGRRIVQAARRFGRVFQVGSQQRSMRPNRLGAEFIRSGGLGAIRKVIGYNYPSPWQVRFTAQPIPSGLDWDAWCGPVARVAYHEELFRSRGRPGWMSIRDFSGGEMTAWGAHGLDQIQWALGMDESGPTEVWTEGEPFEAVTYRRPEEPARAEALTRQPRVCFRYGGGITVELGDGPIGGGLFVGEKGWVTLDRERFRGEPVDAIAEVKRAAKLPGPASHLGDWLACIKSRQRPRADVEIGHRSATLCHLGNIARWTGRRLRWDAQGERFIGDTKADRFLDREGRRPWRLQDLL